MSEIDYYLQTMKQICPLIEDNHLLEFRDRLCVQEFAKGEFIFPLHIHHDFIVFITQGLVRTFYVNDRGEEKNAWFTWESQFVTDYPCFLSGEKSNYAFQCMEATRGVLLPKQAIYEGYNTHASLEKYGRLIAEEVVKSMQTRIEDLLFLSAKERYVKTLENESELVQRISIGQLASYLGIERQTLTRIRKEVLLEK